MNPTRVSHFRGELLDELVVECDEALIHRSGTARYEISLQTPTGPGVVRLWTTAKGRIEVRADDPAPSDWLVEYEPAARDLTSLRTTACTVHLEHLDRGRYALTLEAASGEPFLMHFSAPGYLNAKLFAAER